MVCGAALKYVEDSNPLPGAEGQGEDRGEEKQAFFHCVLLGVTLLLLSNSKIAFSIGGIFGLLLAKIARVATPSKAKADRFHLFQGADFLNMPRIRFEHLNFIQQSPLVPSWRRAGVLSLFGIDCAKSATIYSRVNFTSKKIKIGEKVFINSGCFLDASDWIELSDYVHLGPDVKIYTSSHDFGNRSCRAGASSQLPVRIGYGSWIGGNSTIMPGVFIAPGCIIGAGSIVTKSTSVDGLYYGSPATRKKDLDPQI